MRREKLIKQYPVTWSANKIEAFRATLLAWYDENSRDLPWRQTKNPYYIWVSEIMLQQTQVNTVIPYYERFIDELPTINALSEVDEEKLMGLWQGLGYYSRVRNMQTAAQQIMANFNGEMPNTLEGLLSLKGIGPYTAGAIASIAFNLPEPALDGNLMRIVARLFEIEGEITLTSTKKQMTAILYQLIDPIRPGDFNQALMDMGATIMTPSNPQPVNHPLKEFDQSYINGTSHLYPVKKKKIKVTEHTWLAYAIRNSAGKWLMRRHTNQELLHGLWHFPLVETNLVMEGSTVPEVIEPFIAHYGEAIEVTNFENEGRLLIPTFSNELFPEFPKVTHVFSHRKWHVQVIPIQIKEAFPLSKADLEWVSIEQLEELPQSTLQRKLFESIVTDRI